MAHLEEMEYSNACFHLYPVMVRNRAEFYQKAKKKGLNLQVHYIPVNSQPYYRELGADPDDTPNAQIYYKKCISLPLYPDLSNRDLDEIIKRMRGIL